MLYSGFNILHRSVVRRQTGFAARITRTLCRLAKPLESNSMDAPHASYHAKRMTLNVSVEIQNGKVAWTYKTFRGQWKHTAPIHTLEPIPMFTTFLYYTRTAIWLFSISLPVCIVLFVTLGATIFPIVSAVLAFLAISTLLLCDTFTGPVRWATFESEFNNRDVTLFQANSVDEFEAFVENLSLMIESSRKENENAG